MCMDVILCVRDGRQFLLSQRKTFSSACFNINIHVIYKTNKHSPYKATPINNSLTRIKPNRWINQRNSPSASLYFLLQAVDSELTYIISALKETKNVHVYTCMYYCEIWYSSWETVSVNCRDIECTSPSLHVINDTYLDCMNNQN